MAIKKHRKVFFGSLFVILVVSLIFTLSLNTAGKNEKNTGQFPKVELLKVEYEQCFSPNGESEENSPAVKLNKSFSGGQGGDPLAWVRHAAHFKKAPLAAGGEKDTMPLSAYFKGREHKHVYAFLFVKQGKQVLRFLAGTTRFPASGEAVISLTWDGRDEAGQTVLDGNYDVQLFYFNFPSLFNSRGLKPHKTYEKLLEAIAKKSDRQQVIEWNGMVTVDTTTPELIINAPRDGLETHLEQIETSGTAVGGIILTINNNPVTIESGAFSSQLPLVIGENTFTYVLEDCGGNISEKTVFVTRIRYLPPQVTFNASPGSIEAGQSAVLSWSTTDAETVTIDNGIGSVGINGSVTVSPTQDATYTITAVGPGGTVSEEITIEVTINQEHFTAVYGRVFDMASGSPLSGAVVTVVVGGENNQKFFGG
ncbi:MAG: hypothetical protein KAW12_00785, partial [Candidatus Aminicenantes bacterium]|nr:hypothetical protein [Candidatus Aminicenantes bacterium]